jgi:AraC-like DNA-binding protein
MLVHRPPPPLAAHVDMIWAAEREALPHDRERMLPTGCVDIVIPLLQDSVIRFDGLESTEPQHFKGAVVQGPHDRFIVRGTGGASSVVGVHFKPGGARAFFGGALGDLRGRTVLLEDVWGPSVRTLRDDLQACASPSQRVRLLEVFLIGRMTMVDLDPVVAFALHRFQMAPSSAWIQPVQTESGCSPAQFIQRFQSEVGLTPKRYTRVLRFNAVLGRLVRRGPREWAEVALDAGYFDQSHFIHEFKTLTGLTPSAYEPVSEDQPTHVAVGPSTRPR